MIEITYKSAWFLMHRINEAMRDGDLSPTSGDGGIVEVDETFIGKKKGAMKRRAFDHKIKVLALVDRDSGKARTMVVTDDCGRLILRAAEAKQWLRRLVAKDKIAN